MRIFVGYPKRKDLPDAEWHPSIRKHKGCTYFRPWSLIRGRVRESSVRSVSYMSDLWGPARLE